MSDPLISVVEPENEDPFAWRERLSLRLTRAFLAVFSAVGVVISSGANLRFSQAFGNNFFTILVTYLQPLFQHF